MLLRNFVGAPVAATTSPTINLTHVVAVVEFMAAELGGRRDERTPGVPDEVALEMGVRFNSHGPAGLIDRAAPGHQSRLNMNTAPHWRG
jgi:hypothetical protein